MLISTLHRAGNEKDGDEQADTVGCCSLRVEHIELHEQKVPVLLSEYNRSVVMLMSLYQVSDVNFDKNLRESSSILLSRMAKSMSWSLTSSERTPSGELSYRKVTGVINESLEI